MKLLAPSPLPGRLSAALTLLLLAVNSLPTKTLPDETEPSEKATLQAGQPINSKAALSGYVRDESGAPIMDAQVILRGPDHSTSALDDNGFYEFPAVKTPGDYQVSVVSKNWVNLTGTTAAPKIRLGPDKPMTHNFILQKAGSIQVRLIDDMNNPIAGAIVGLASMTRPATSGPMTERTGDDGLAVLGGIRPSEARYMISARAPNFAPSFFVAQVRAPGLSEARTVRLSKGITISGVVVCSDGEPPAGWKIQAIPTWLMLSGARPTRTEIRDDGAFELKNVGRGVYNVVVSIPGSDGEWEDHQVLAGKLVDMPEPLQITLDLPSPAAMTAITGKIKSTGTRPSTLRLRAISNDHKFSADTLVKTGQNEFKIGPLPRGLYSIRAQAPTLQPFELKNVSSPGENIVVELHEMVRPRLVGKVLSPIHNEPLKDLQLRVRTTKRRSTSAFSRTTGWKLIKSINGEFSVPVERHGTYVINAVAEGFAATDSEPINTMESTGPVQIVLDRGITLQGVVVNEQGEPVAGATVLAESRKSRAAYIGGVIGTGEVRTDEDGRFIIPNLPRGKEHLTAMADNYAVAEVSELNLEKRPNEPLTIVLPIGGTVRGLVFDVSGHVAANQTIVFRNRRNPGNDGPGNVSVSSDRHGFYSAKNLPSNPISIRRTMRQLETGVIRRVVVPQSGKTLTVMLGGPHQLTGVLRINGKEHRNGRLRLGSRDLTFGSMDAYSDTNADAHFSFAGVPPGVWWLYYEVVEEGRERWQPVQQIEVGPNETADLGIIDSHQASVSVRVKASGFELPSPNYMHLTATDPLRRYGRSFFDFYPRDQGEGEFFFERVPLGQFYLTSLAKPRVFVRKVVNVESDQLKLPVEIDLPRSTASISGRVAPAIANSGRLLQLIPTDRSWFAYSSIENDGNFAFDAVPTGECTISVLKHLTWEPIQTLQLSDGPNEHLSIKGKDDHPFLPNGVSAIRVCTPDGAITDCHVSLKGPHGVINSSNEDGGQYHFCVPPGNYQATVRLKGFQTEELPIEVFPFTVDGTANPNRLTTVILREQ